MQFVDKYPLKSIIFWTQKPEKEKWQCKLQVSINEGYMVETLTDFTIDDLQNPQN